MSITGEEPQGGNVLLRQVLGMHWS
jgi:hypothetical protein